MCRYLLSAPPKPEDTAHRLRLMFGNGMRPQIWNEFVKRFNIKRVSEFYGSSEGNANICKIRYFSYSRIKKKKKNYKRKFLKYFLNITYVLKLTLTVGSAPLVLCH